MHLQFLTRSLSSLRQVKFEEEISIHTVAIQRPDAAQLAAHYVHLMDKDQVILATADLDSHVTWSSDWTTLTADVTKNCEMGSTTRSTLTGE